MRRRSCSTAASSCSRRARWRESRWTRRRCLRAGESGVRQRRAAPAGAADRRQAGTDAHGGRRRSSLRADGSPARRRRCPTREIRSPINGVVTDRPLYPGEMATTGAPLLTVMDVSAIVARINMAQDQAKDVKVGDEATMTPADGSEPVTGKVTVVSPATDPNSTTVQVWVQADNPGERLRAGQSVHVAIVAATIDGATLVPAAGDPRRRRGRRRSSWSSTTRTSRTTGRWRWARKEPEMVQVQRRRARRARRHGRRRRASTTKPEVRVMKPGEKAAGEKDEDDKNKRARTDAIRGERHARPDGAPTSTGPARHGKPIIFVILTLVGDRRLPGRARFRSPSFPKSTSRASSSASTTASCRSIRCWSRSRGRSKRRVNSVQGLERVRSITSRGSAEVDLFFSWNVDMFQTLAARQRGARARAAGRCRRPRRSRRTA